MNWRDMKIGVLMGGLSRERDISLKTGGAILNSLRRQGFDAVGIDVDHKVIEKLQSLKIQVVFNALHGIYGEDGIIQGVLEMLEIPYTGSGVLASSITMNKILTKQILEYNQIPTPRFAIIREEEHVLQDKLPFGFPMVVKPNREGSTFGVSVIKEQKELSGSIKKAREFDKLVFVEEGYMGKEITVGVVDERVFPVIEIVPRKGFYDFESKYTKGATDYIIPARISPKNYREAQRLGKQVFDVLGCLGPARIDIMVDQGDKLGVIEVNSMPGMTETSLLPKAAEYDGISFDELVCLIMDSASLKLSR